MSKRAKELLGIEDDIVVSNENLDSDDVIEVDTVDPIEELYELDESEIDPTDDLDVIEEAMEGLEEAKTKLESLESLVETSLTTGGLTRDSIPYIQFAIESASGDYLSSTEVKFPSIESFNEEDSRVQNTAYVLEGIKDKFKEYTLKSAKFVKKWGDAVAKFWKDNITAIGRQKNHLEKLIKLIESDEKRFGSEPEEKEIKVSSKVAEHLSTNGTLSDSEISSGLVELTKVIKSLKDGNELTDRLIEQSKILVDGETTSVKHLTVVEAAEILKKEAPALHYKEVFNEDDIIVNLVSQPLLGNKKVNIDIDGNIFGFTSDKDTIVKNISVELVKAEKYNKDKNSLPTLNGKEIIKFSKEALELLNVLEKDGRSYRIANDEVDKLLLAQGKILEYNARQKDKKAAKGHSLSTYKTAVALIEPRKSLHKHALSVIQSLYVYLLESAKAHKHEKSLSKEELAEKLLVEDTAFEALIEELTFEGSELSLEEMLEVGIFNIELESLDNISLESFATGFNTKIGEWVAKHVTRNVNKETLTKVYKALANQIAKGGDYAKKGYAKIKELKIPSLDKAEIFKWVKELSNAKKIAAGVALSTAVGAAGYKAYKAKKTKEESESEISEEDIKEITINQNTGNKDMSIKTTDVELSQEEIEYFDGLALEELEVSIEGLKEWWTTFKTSFDKLNGTIVDQESFTRLIKGYNSGIIPKEQVADILAKSGMDIKDVDVVLKASKRINQVSGAVAIAAAIAVAYKLYKKFKAKKAEKESETEVSKEELEAFVTTLTLEELEDLNLDCIATEEYEAQLEVSVEEISWSAFKEAAGKFFNKDVLAAIKLGDADLVVDTLKEKGAPTDTISKVVGLVKSNKKALLAATAGAALAVGGHKLYKHLKAKYPLEEGSDKEELANEAIVEILSDYSLEELTDLFDVMIGNEEIGTSLEAATYEQIKAGAKFWEGKQIKGVKGSVVKSITEAFAKGGEHAKKAYTWIKDHSIDSEGAKKLYKWGTELSNTKKGLAAAGIAAAGAGLLYKAHKDAKAKKAAEAEKESESSTEE